MVSGQPEDISKILANFNAIAAVLNGNIDATNFASGDIFDPNKILQSGATAGQGLVWNGTDWAPASIRPIATLASVSAANTDLASPASGHQYLQVYPTGGGTIRSIGLPPNSLSGRYVIHNLSGASVTIKNATAGGTGAQIGTRSGADVVLAVGDAIDLIYDGTFWREVGRMSPSATTNYGTTLPGSPANGDVAVLVDSTSAPSYEWFFRYNSTAGKWMFEGGPPHIVEITTDQATLSGTYTDLGTVGPSFTLPYAGVWIIGVGFRHGATTNGTTVTMYMSYDIGATGAVDADSAACVVSGNQSAYKIRKKTIASAAALVSKYHLDGTNSNSFRERILTILPVSI